MDAQRRLVEDARAGDADAFDVLVRQNVDVLYRAARLILHDPDLAEDALQDALVRAWRDLRTLKDTERFPAWLQKLLVRACYDAARHERRVQARVRLLPPGGVEPGFGSSVADRDAIEHGLRRVSQEHRAVLVLHFYLDLSPAEIADRLGVRPGTARSRLHYAIAALRAAVEAEERMDSANARGAS